MPTDPPVAKTGGGIKGLTERLARRSCKSEAGPREPRITHHPAQSYRNMTRQSIFLTYLATWSRNIKHCLTRLLYLERYFRSTVYWTRVSWARLGGRLLVDSYRDSKLLGTGRKDHPYRLHTWAIQISHSFEQTPGSRQWSTFECLWQEHDPTEYKDSMVHTRLEIAEPEDTGTQSHFSTGTCLSLLCNRWTNK